MSQQEKYDRQIRLWGADGQKCIQDAVIVSLGSDAICAEILKNLVLHAVGKVIIVDDAIVTEDDIGVNFMVDEDSIGKKRAEVVKELLNEMNPDPEILTLDASPLDISVLNSPDLNENSIIISTGNQSKAWISQISDSVREKGFKYLHLQTIGFFGIFYLDAGKFHYFEGGDRTTSGDLRIINPWPELQEFMESFNLEEMPNDEHVHLPYTVILYNARKNALQRLGKGRLEFRDKGIIIEEIRKLARDPEEPWVDKACGSTFSIVDTDPVSFQIKSVFADADNYPDEDFWKVIKAARTFTEREGVPPHDGVLEDMECSTEVFKAMRAVYQAKFEADNSALRELCPDVDPALVTRIQKCLFRCGGISYPSVASQVEECGQPMGLPQIKNAIAVRSLFAGLRRFKEENGREATLEDKDELEKVTPVCELRSEYVREGARFAGNILPSIAATMAAVAAQEITKIIIRKATPVTGTLVYDGIHGVFHTFSN